MPLWNEPGGARPLDRRSRGARRAEGLRRRRLRTSRSWPRGRGLAGSIRRGSRVSHCSAGALSIAMSGPTRPGARSRDARFAPPVFKRMRREGETITFGAFGCRSRRFGARDTIFLSSRTASGAGRKAFVSWCWTARRGSLAGAAGGPSGELRQRGASHRLGRKLCLARSARRSRTTTPWRPRASCGRSPARAWRRDRSFPGSSTIRNPCAAWPEIAMRRFRPRRSGGARRLGSALSNCSTVPARARFLGPRGSRSIS